MDGTIKRWRSGGGAGIQCIHNFACLCVCVHVCAHAHALVKVMYYYYVLCGRASVRGRELIENYENHEERREKTGRPKSLQTIIKSIIVQRIHKNKGGLRRRD